MKSNELVASGTGNSSESVERSSLGLSEDVQRAFVDLRKTHPSSPSDPPTTAGD
ncbi:hypothetical protein RE6C_04381 [Rhodopirellula europaea 6C]|uniref:Uncharacterized protein n=1 Tax=Rhodopirellula europaea 6C TaxID=1263867 RepID=M2AZE0_9BACT|nr:hypothetical protein RE6C_04381 [Rhodopirellula europaea 6C]